jgi:hypothetical protein
MRVEQSAEGLTAAMQARLDDTEAGAEQLRRFLRV